MSEIVLHFIQYNSNINYILNEGIHPMVCLGAPASCYSNLKTRHWKIPFPLAQTHMLYLIVNNIPLCYGNSTMTNATSAKQGQTEMYMNGYILKTVSL